MEIPGSALNYIKKIEELTGGEIILVGSGPERAEIITR